MRADIVSANIGRTNMTASRVEADFWKIRRNTKRAVIGWQEIDEGDIADEHELLAEVFGAGYRHVGFKQRVPITVDIKTIRVVDSDSFRASAGIPHASPPRWITVAHCRPRFKLLGINKGVEFVVINCHWPAGAFNADEHQSNEELRDKRWKEVTGEMRAVIKEYADKGITVFWTGDTNRMNMPKLHKRERQVWTKGIDSVSVIEGRTRVFVKNKRDFELNSDHDAVVVTVDLKGPKRKKKNHQG